uniref:Uncharacterized protein n=1 Tax=Aegilops tauschii subsp. strangulata TaxID=200361 RepID=A0A453CGT0_AEGTS
SLFCAFHTSTSPPSYKSTGISLPDIRPHLRAGASVCTLCYSVFSTIHCPLVEPVYCSTRTTFWFNTMLITDWYGC